MELFICILIPLHLLPAFIGFYLIFQPARVQKLIGWFTFKPVLATPLFLLIYIGNHDSLSHFASLLPGLILTLLLLWAYRDFFRGPTVRITVSLLILDLIRWGSALVSVIFNEYDTFCLGTRLTGCGLVFFFAMAFPTLYAIAALVLSRSATRESPAANTGEVSASGS